MLAQEDVKKQKTLDFGGKTVRVREVVSSSLKDVARLILNEIQVCSISFAAVFFFLKKTQIFISAQNRQTTFRFLICTASCVTMWIILPTRFRAVCR
jgi:hypothetical protein